MPLIMVQPTPHPKTGVYRVRLSVPESLRGTARRLGVNAWELSASLATKDKRAALKAAPLALAKLQARLDDIRAVHDGGARSLSNQEIHAVAGAWYKERAGLNEANPGTAEGWEAYGDSVDDTPDYTPDTAALERAAELLAHEHGIAADGRSVLAVATALRSAEINIADLMSRRAGGDYGADKVAERFPAMPVSSRTAPEAPPAGTTFDSLLRGWALDSGHDPDAKPIIRAYYDRARTIARLAAFLEHSDASKVTKADAVRWKQSMQERNLAGATVRNDLSEMSAIWKIGKANGKVLENPFAEILPKKQTKGRPRIRQYEPNEAATVLLAARQQSNAALRWLPWLCALTGARLSEICQSSKGDILTIAGLPFINIHDDSTDRQKGEAKRSVKNDHSIRTVPIHPALEAEGFLAYVASLPDGSLFPDVKPDAVFGKRSETAGRAVRDWLRGLGITDRRISPSHSWRHWFIGAARRVDMNQEARHAITGHADDDNESHAYGDNFREMPDRLTEEMAKITLPPGVPPRTL